MVSGSADSDSGHEAVEFLHVVGAPARRRRSASRAKPFPLECVVGDDVVVVDTDEQQQQGDEDPGAVLPDRAMDHCRIHGGLGQHREGCSDRLVRRHERFEIMGRDMFGTAPADEGRGFGQRIAQRQVVVGDRGIRESTRKLDL